MYRRFCPFSLLIPIIVRKRAGAFYDFDYRRPAQNAVRAGRSSMAKKQEYGNESITSLKGADRVRKRPAVIFGSDGVEGLSLIHI